MTAAHKVTDTEVITNFDVFRNNLKSKFPTLTEDDSVAWRDIINCANLMDIPANTSLLNPDSLCDQFILLLSGQVRVYQQTSEDREVTLYRIEAGNLCVLSINGLLLNKTFSAFANAETNVQALILSRQQFFQAMAVSEAFREYVLINLSNHFRDLLDLMEVTIFESLDTRLICMLGRLSRTSGSDIVHITHRELARELGTSREVVSRLLKGLERKSCIKLGRGIIEMTA